MVEIEFGDPGAGEEADEASYEDDGAGADLRQWLPALAAGVAWVGAAGLAVMASLSTVYQLRYRGSGLDEKVSVDAWGRYDPTSVAQGLGHATRFAVVLVAAAVLLFAAAMLTVPRLPLARYVGVAGLAAAAASAATLFLNVDATRSSYAAQGVRAIGGSSSGSAAPTLHVELGAAAWLAVASAVLALAGVVLALVLRSADGPPPPEFEPST